MLRFPIHWQIPYPNGFQVFPMHPQVKLNDEWKIVRFRNGREPEFIEICRQITSEEILVCGTLSLQRSGITVSTQEFSKLIQIGSSSITINFPDPPTNTLVFSAAGTGSNYLSVFSGNIYIAVISKGDDKCTQQKSLVQLSNDFERLLDPETFGFTDFNLICGDVTIPAHKIILSTRSPVFAAMFDNEMRENHENQVNITDMDASVVRAMMIYIYAGKTSNLTVPSASDLLFAADKYQLEDLKRVCCDFLKQNASIQNVLRILVLGDMHAEDLKSFAVDYICNKCTDFSVVESSEEWKTVRKERADLAIDVLTSIVKSRDGLVLHALKVTSTVPIYFPSSKK